MFDPIYKGLQCISKYIGRDKAKMVVVHYDKISSLIPKLV
jgi:hypothetical protein